MLFTYLNFATFKGWGLELGLMFSQTPYFNDNKTGASA